MPGRILITAFEPFGLIRGVFQGKNSSRQVLREIEARGPDRWSTKVLPVSDKAEDILRRTLADEDPAGVVSMGEVLDLTTHVNVEPYAVRAPVSAFPEWLSFTRHDRVKSPFAESLAEGEGAKLRSNIQRYYCNRIYLTGLGWANAKGRPAVFLHVPVFGNRDKHVREVLTVLEKMEQGLPV